MKRVLRPVYHAARALGRRLLNHVGPSPHIVHSIATEEEFFQGLDRHDNPLIAKACDAFKSGDQQSALRHLSSHFRSRRSPRFFIDSEAITAAVDTVSRDFSDWYDSVLRDADELSQGRLKVYAIDVTLKSSADWDSIPLGPGRDILYRERPHRFGFVPRLALASVYGHDDALPTLERLVKGWMESVQSQISVLGMQNSFAASSHVALYRVVAISWALAFIHAKDESNDELEFLLLRILYGDALYINQCLPETTANNHLLADGFGLWYLGAIFPEFKSANTWLSRGHQVFCAEMARQIYPDGSSFEQSIHYQEHACEMAAAYLLLSEKNAWDVDKDIENKSKAMFHFQAMVTGRDGNSFALGDTTEDPLFPLDAGDGWCGPAMSVLSGTIFGDGSAICEPSLPSTEKAFWLSGGGLPFVKMTDDTSTPSIFPDGGFAFFDNSAREARLLFRTGPAENLELVPGHMHADFLSLYLVVKEQAVILPTGTYTYRSDPADWPLPYMGWREYFLSPESSNGIAIGHTDPLLRSGGDFPGGVKGDIASRVKTGCGASSNHLQWLSACVVGGSEYEDLTRGVLQVGENYWLVIDWLPSFAKDVPVSAHLQLAPSSQVHSMGDSTLRIECGAAQLLLSWSDDMASPLQREGGMSPKAGWVSPAYGVLLAAPQLVFPIKAEAAFVVLGISLDQSGGANMEIKRALADGPDLKVVVDCGMHVDYFNFSLPEIRMAEPSRISWSRHREGREIASDDLVIR